MADGSMRRIAIVGSHDAGGTELAVARSLHARQSAIHPTAACYATEGGFHLALERESHGAAGLALVTKHRPCELSADAPMAGQLHVHVLPDVLIDVGRAVGETGASEHIVDGTATASVSVQPSCSSLLGSAQSALEAIVLPLLQRASLIAADAGTSGDGSGAGAENSALAKASRQAGQLLHLLSLASGIGPGGRDAASIPVFSTLLAAEPELAPAVGRCVAAGRLLSLGEAGVPEELLRSPAFIARLEASLGRWRGVASRVADAPTERAAAAAASTAAAATLCAQTGPQAGELTLSAQLADLSASTTSDGGRAIFQSIATECAFLVSWQQAMGELTTQLSPPAGAAKTPAPADGHASAGGPDVPPKSTTISAAAYGVALTLDALRHSQRLFSSVSFSNDVPVRVSATLSAAEPVLAIARRLGPAAAQVAAATTTAELDSATDELARAWGAVRTSAASVDKAVALRLLDACSHALLACAVDVIGMRELLRIPLAEAQQRVAQFGALIGRWADGDGATPPRDAGGARLRQLLDSEQRRIEAVAVRSARGDPSSQGTVGAGSAAAAAAVFDCVQARLSATGHTAIASSGSTSAVLDDARVLSAAYAERWTAVIALRLDHAALLSTLGEFRSLGLAAPDAGRSLDSAENIPEHDGRVASALASIADAWTRLVGGGRGSLAAAMLDPADVSASGNAAWSARTLAYAESARHVDSLLGAALVAGIERAGSSSGTGGSTLHRKLHALASAQQLLSRRGRALVALKPLQVELLDRVKDELIVIQVRGDGGELDVENVAPAVLGRAEISDSAIRWQWCACMHCSEARPDDRRASHVAGGEYRAPVLCIPVLVRATHHGHRVQTLRRRVDGCATQLARGCGDQWETLVAGWGRNDVPFLVRSLRKSLDPGQPLSLWTAQVKESLALAVFDPNSRMALGSCLFKVFAYAVHAAAPTTGAEGVQADLSYVDAVSEASRRVPVWLSDTGGMFAVAVEPRASVSSSATTSIVTVAVVNFSSDLVDLAREYSSVRAAKTAIVRGALRGEAPNATATSAPGSLRDLDIDFPHEIRSHISTVREGVAYAVVLRHLLGRLLDAHRVGEEAGDSFQSALLPYRVGVAAPRSSSGYVAGALADFSGRAVIQMLLSPVQVEVQVRSSMRALRSACSN